MIDRPFWRRGYASEAAAGVRDYAFNVLRKPRVISLVRPVNLPSQAVARKLRMMAEKVIMWKELEHIVFALANPSL
jgi:RimJ/RimL family protein N-acetyltransferase